MSVKCILSAYSGDASRGSGLRYALHLAQQRNAWITGVLAHSQSDLERTLRGRVPKRYLETFFEAEKGKIQDVSQRFHEITKEAGLEQRSEFVDLSEENGISLSEFARSFDLIVTGTHSYTVDEEHMSANPDLIALQSGRPVLVVPDGYHADRLAEHALVAWDGKRSSARAIGDAMSTLEEKAKVTVLTVGTKRIAGTDALLRNLERHGIEANFILMSKGGTIAKTILSVAEEICAKLVVMGAFEHSKFSQDVFGGVTTDVINKTDVPVLLSH
ncbi:universal stress protein A [Amylibacter ulvae]|uniref:Universal stress protein A n=1 Tax=Paramylibacter ulvae TaxID=1651968 RepID=A0ABQ3CW35_9RHOB|nr:universal stress protein [Amylibacter ulvae]GHA43830.1 universal stress protein A [Amylibacter ulvae]